MAHQLFDHLDRYSPASQFESKRMPTGVGMEMSLQSRSLSISVDQELDCTVTEAFIRRNSVAAATE